MTAVYHGRGEKMEGYEIYRLSDEEIQHVGVKGMKWGKRKSRSAYMTAVDKHEAKTKANREKVAAHKAREKEQGKAVAKAIGTKYMNAVDKHEAKTKANRQKVADHKAREKAQGKAVAKAVGKKYMDASRSHEAKTTAKRDAKKAASKVKLSKDEKDAIAEEKFWAKDAKDKARVERNKARMAKVMGQKAVDVLTAPENRVKIAAVTSVIAAYAGTQMGSSKNARLMREFNSHNYKI